MPKHLTWSRPLFWTIGLTLVAGEVLAFWIVCSHQVQLAQARRTATQVTRMALNDCLEYVQGSTIASCQRHVGGRR